MEAVDESGRECPKVSKVATEGNVTIFFFLIFDEGGAAKFFFVHLNYFVFKRAKSFLADPPLS